MHIYIYENASILLLSMVALMMKKPTIPSLAPVPFVGKECDSWLCPYISNS